MNLLDDTATDVLFVYDITPDYQYIISERYIVSAG